MSRAIIKLAAISFILAIFAATPCLAGPSVPDLKGTWTGTNYGMVAGHTPHTEKRKMDQVKTLDLTLTIKIDKQEGARFAGIKTSKKYSERVVGVIAPDNKTIYMVDEDGYFDGRLTPDNKLELCYRHTNRYGLVAACTVYTKK
jgi:hypothetical protein